MTRALSRLAAAPLAAFLLSAAPPATIIPLPAAADEALVIPAASPVQFERFDRYAVAHFRGSFVLSGTFTYGCTIDCDGPLKDRFYRLDFTPDPEMADRLPHWRIRGSVPSLVITNERSFLRATTTPQRYAALHKGKLADIRGRTRILVDHFTAAIECDAPAFTARFMRIVETPNFASNIPDGDAGCG